MIPSIARTVSVVVEIIGFIIFVGAATALGGYATGNAKLYTWAPKGDTTAISVPSCVFFVLTGICFLLIGVALDVRVLPRPASITILHLTVSLVSGCCVVAIFTGYATQGLTILMPLLGFYFGQLARSARIYVPKKEDSNTNA